MSMKGREEETLDSSKPQRVVSLLGAATEIIYRLGLGSKLVGRSHECDYPPACLLLPCISRPRLDTDASSFVIDDAVRVHSANGEPVYKLDDAVLSGLDADLLIAQDHCRVCAITPRDLSSSAPETCLNIPQLIVKPGTLRECLDDVNTVANGLGYPERGIALRRTLDMRMDRVRQAVAAVATTKKPRVALLEWCHPIMGCGYWLPELVEMAGGHPLHCPPPGGATPTISFRTLLDSDPDVVVFALCGFGLTRAVKEIVKSWGRERIEELLGSGGGRRRAAFVVDGNYLVNRSGPRVVESAEALAEAIHPSLLGHFGHHGTELLSTVEEAIAMTKAGSETGSAKIRPTPFVEEEDDSKGVMERPRSEAPKMNGGSGGGGGKPSKNPDEAVKLQLQHLRNGDVIKAFAINSAANRNRWCSPDRFAAVMESHDDFRRLLSEPTVVGEACETSAGIATVEVTLPEDDDNGASAVRLLWTMVAEKNAEDDDAISSWHTEKVGMAH